MIGFALRLGTNAAAATMLQLAGIGTRQARVIRSLIVFPFNAVDAAVEAAFGPRSKDCRPTTRPAADVQDVPDRTMPGGNTPEVRPMDMSCPEEEILAAYADHGLTPEEQTWMEDHLVECDACRSRVAIAVASRESEEVCTAYRA